VSLRRLSLVAIAIAIGGGALLLGAPAQGQAPTVAAIVASDFAFRTIGGNPPNVTILAGGHVDFSYPEGSSQHNVVFTGKQPSLCGISAGPASSNSAPLPNSPARALWEGGCDFAETGAYAFVCGLHANMTGSVTVVAPNTTPPPPPPPASPLAPASALRAMSVQRGPIVRGSVVPRAAGSRLLARAFATRRSLYSSSRSSLQVRVGRQLRSSVPSGRVAFRVALNSVARRALRRNGRLSISLRLTVTPPDGGKSYTATRTVILRAP